MGSSTTNQSLCLWNCPSQICCTVPSALSSQAGKVQALTEEERAHILPLLRNAQWVEVVGRDAIYKEFIFKDFNQVLASLSNITFKLKWPIKPLYLFILIFFYFSPSRLLASCPEWLYMQRSWTIILSGSMSIIRYASLIINDNENNITAYGVGVVFLAPWTAGFCYYRKAQHWNHELAWKWPLLNVIFALKQ